jgi:hypothetical protein
MISAGGLSVAKDARVGGTTYSPAFATNPSEDMYVTSGASMTVATAASETYALKQGTDDRVVFNAAGDVTVTVGGGFCICTWMCCVD